MTTAALRIPSPRRSPARSRSKRVLDVVISVAGLIVVAPILAITAAAVKIQDGGPVFYRRRCVGLGGAEFDAFKFRSMRVDADQLLQHDAKLRERFEQNYKLKDDPRVTAVGAVLRTTSIDELPQLWNVVRGEMSLVGPRMITPRELAKYGDAASHLLSVKPGITGYWQTEGRQERSYQERVDMDIHYVEHWSLGFDLRILLRTPLKVLRREGAY